MIKHKCILRTALAALSVISLNPAAMATGTGAPEIDEGLVTTTLHVAAFGGSDGNPGTEGSPLATLAEAFARYNGGSGGYRIILLPGTHRPGTAGTEPALSLPGTIPATRPLILEGSGWSPGTHTGDVVISGSEDWSGVWTNAGTENGRTAWEKAWPYVWGLSINISAPAITPPDVVRTYHLVHVGGVTYYEVLGAGDPTIANLSASEGYFHVDEATNLIRVVPPASIADLNTKLVEVSTRRTLLRYFRPQAETSPTPLAVRNLVFRHAAPGLAGAAFRAQNHNGFILEDCHFVDNKNGGLALEGNSATTFTVRRCTIAGNGATGAGFRAANALVTDSRFEGNSRQADVAEFYGWDYGGFKIGESSNVSFTHLFVKNNYGVGMWIDTGNVGILVDNCYSKDNTTTGIFIENNNSNTIPGLGSATTVEVRNSTFAYNIQTSPANPVVGRGIYITESENVVIHGCLVYGNQTQLRIADGPLRGPVGNVEISNSSLVCLDAGQALIDAAGATSWSQFISTYSPASDGNNWYTPASTIAFPDASRAITLNLAGWKSLVGAEAHSTWGTALLDVGLETSTDQANWVPATSGIYDVTEAERFFRVTLEKLAL
jgi:hypothetical protein